VFTDSLGQFLVRIVFRDLVSDSQRHLLEPIALFAFGLQKINGIPMERKISQISMALL